MNVLDTLLQFAETTLVFYVAYVVLGSLAFGFLIWRRVYATPKAIERRLRPRLHDSDSNGR
ncbi:hypothetical protein [Herbaspirillum sp. alder98]|uniref:hypothetical protein n=1 Tax=Herbaspirillum sp. alder98 TaxID=2913096 RepID=UPI001CD8D34F|nr:hypothetical protein [Herbaspirillum sp. alder98]MCA1323836.1 hypothetical protein [Herbaspirillum sp. alder98]